MSKIICDVCGTSYPEIAEQCPICGSVRPADVRSVVFDYESEDNQPGYNYVKGGRFSKANVKKRNQAKQAGQAYEPEYVAPEEPEEKKTNKGLIVTAIVLFVAILALLAFILIRFLGSGASTAQKDPQADSQTEPSITEPVETTSPLEIPCTGLKITGNTSNTIRLNEIGDSQTLVISLTPANTTDSVTFTSDDETVVVVSADGKVEAVGSGLTTIVITCGEQTLECLVVCDFELPTEETTEPTEPLIDYTIEDMKLNVYQKNELGQYDMQMDIGQKWKIYVGNIPLEEIKLHTEDPSIARVEGNAIVGVRSGITMFYAEYGELKVECIVRVTTKQYGGLPGSDNVGEA